MAGASSTLTRRSSLSASTRYWTLVAILIAIPSFSSLLIILFSFLQPEREVIGHLFSFVLPRVSFNTVVLVLGVTMLAGVVGVSLAWLTAMFQFPGRQFFNWALLLPMAMPGYVTAFVAIGFFEYAGPLQSALRGLLGPDIWFPQIRSRTGLIIVMALALYPYVYLLARNAFMSQGRRALEVGQSLGLTLNQGFLRVALPMARPWIAAGLMLVAMETLADFGTVSVFNYDTFTTAIYQAWFSLFSINSALQLAFFLLLLVFLLIGLERKTRGRMSFISSMSPAKEKKKLRGIRAWLACGAATGVFALGFALPAVQLILWGIQDAQIDARFLALALRTIGLATTAAVIITITAMVLVYALRYSGRVAQVAGRIATLGYALPGTVLAVGIYTQISGVNNLLNKALASWFGLSVELFLQNTIIALLLAYLIRFLAVAFQSVDSSMQRVTFRIDETARSLGVSGWQLLRRVHVPLLRNGLLTASILVFVDVMKEMPITLMTRPFGWDTFAVRVFELTAEGQWQQAALPALSIVLVGLLPVMLVTKASGHAITTR
ncbi:MAG: iron ABC transporter permease [Gammaproteobacteria bacterium]|nr:iron ABC transporter permease [Gammaproteobacteria bacterium]